MISVHLVRRALAVATLLATLTFTAAVVPMQGATQSQQRLVLTEFELAELSGMAFAIGAISATAATTETAPKNARGLCPRLDTAMERPWSIGRDVAPTPEVFATVYAGVMEAQADYMDQILGFNCGVR